MPEIISAFAVHWYDTPAAFGYSIKTGDGSEWVTVVESVVDGHTSGWRLHALPGTIGAQLVRLDIVAFSTEDGGRVPTSCAVGELQLHKRALDGPCIDMCCLHACLHT